MITVRLMKVKALPSKAKSDSKPVHDDPTRNLGGRSWKQDAIRHRLLVTLALIGVLMMKQGLKKRLIQRQKSSRKTSDLIGATKPVNHGNRIN